MNTSPLNHTNMNPAPKNNVWKTNMEKSESQAPSMSLLSAFMLTRKDSNSQRSLKLAAKSSMSEHDGGEDSCHSEDDPPQSLLHLPEGYLGSGNPPLGTTSPMPKLPCKPRDASAVWRGVAGSPLSTISQQSLSKQYDADTWRMYERIQSARLKANDALFSLVRETVDNIQHPIDPSGLDESTPSMRFNRSEPDFEADAIFDLDM